MVKNLALLLSATPTENQSWVERIVHDIIRETRIAEAERWADHVGHEDTYEGSCGVHMPSHCSTCIMLKRAGGV